MIDGVTPGAALSALMSSFAGYAGLPPVGTDDAQGLELEAPPYVARVLPHPADDTQLVVEIDVCPKDEASGDALEVLHRLNYAARFAHPWTAGIDAEDTIVIYTQRPIADTDVGALDALIGDGIARAAALRALWTSACARTPVVAPGSVATFGAIRG